MDPSILRAVTWVIGLDGDDTLWENEAYFREVQAECTRLLTRWAHGDGVHERLLTIERRNLELFGYGVKGFALSMIETAIELSDGEIPAADIHRIVDLARDMLARPHELINGVADAVADLAERHRLVLITKGDLLHQQTKVASSGLADRFDAVEIVAEKDPPTYQAVLDRHGIAPEHFVMVGNSVRSDVLPVLALGARAVHVPHLHTWELEQVTHDPDHDYPVISSLAELGPLLDELEPA